VPPPDPLLLPLLEPLLLPDPPLLELPPPPVPLQLAALTFTLLAELKLVLSVE
jgi:hypothetical protein